MKAAALLAAALLAGCASPPPARDGGGVMPTDSGRWELEGAVCIETARGAFCPPGALAGCCGILDISGEDPSVIVCVSAHAFDWIGPVEDRCSHFMRDAGAP